MAINSFDFEKPLTEIDEQIETLRAEEGDNEEEDKKIAKDLEGLKKKRKALKKKIYGNLEAWDRVQIARHKDRPRAIDFINALTTEWTEVKGDRNFRDDPAIACGLARIGGEPVAVMGQLRGHDTRENVKRNFGMMHPEGYRKALRFMRLAERFELPIIIFIDTPGAYPGIGAEERGQSEAIARNIMEMFSLKTPIIGIIIGEGASGGALGVGIVDYMIMFENSWYCVISPEGCASILWRDASKAPEVAKALKLSAPDLLEFKIADEIIPEPEGGAHYDPPAAIENLRKPLIKQIQRLKKKKTDTLLKERFEKFRHVGVIGD